MQIQSTRQNIPLSTSRPEAKIERAEWSSEPKDTVELGSSVLKYGFSGVGAASATLGYLGYAQVMSGANISGGVMDILDISAMPTEVMLGVATTAAVLGGLGLFMGHQIGELLSEQLLGKSSS